jgi:hypothetical protein
MATSKAPEADGQRGEKIMEHDGQSELKSGEQENVHGDILKKERAGVKDLSVHDPRPFQ